MTDCQSWPGYCSITLVRYKKIFLFAAFVTAAAIGCSSAGKKSAPVPEHVLPFEKLARAFAVEELWKKQMPGLITDLTTSGDGKNVLVATAPNREAVPGGSGRYELILMRDDGKTAWRRPLNSPVKAQAISRDGSLIVISTYDDQIVGIDSKGATRWSVDGMCRPHVLEKSGKVICYHDDDAEPGIAFRVIDKGG
jgi:hypothetical protein